MSEARVEDAAPAAPAEPAVAIPEPIAAVPEPAPPPEAPPAPAPEPAPPPPAPEPPAPEPEPTPGPEPAAAEPEIRPHTEEPGVLQAAEEAKEEEPAKPAEEAKPEEKPAEPGPEPIKYEFQFPENIEVRSDMLEEFEGFAQTQRFSPETAQKLVDFHVAAMQAEKAAEIQRQHDAFADMRRGWRNNIMADEDLGGAGFQTNQSAAIRMLQLFIPEGRREAFDQFLMITGATDNPEFFRFLVNLARKFDEPAPVPAPTPRVPLDGAAGRPPSAGNSRLSYSYPRGNRRSTG